MLSAEEIYKILLTAYGKPRWWSDDPFTVMFQSVLVQNTAWSSVEKTCTPIGDKLTPEYIGNLPTEELEQLISPCGFYKAKARTIQALVSWYRSYHFDRKEVQSVTISTRVQFPPQGNNATCPTKKSSLHRTRALFPLRRGLPAAYGV